MNKKTQKGFAHVESLLLLVIVVMIIAIGWFVWHTKQQADKNYNAASSVNLNTPGAKKKEASTTTSTTTKKAAPKIVTYTNTSASGVEVKSASDVDKLEGAPDSLKDFLKDKLNKNGNAPAPCGNAYGLFVQKIYKDEFALGNVGNCKNADKLWVLVNESWTEVEGSANGFDCSVLEQYKVPSAIVDHCVKNGQQVDNTQE